MKNKKLLYLLVLSFMTMMLVSSCGTVEGIFGKSSVKVEKQEDKIAAVDTQISNIQNNKISEISNLNYGTGYALSKLTNAPIQVVVAKEMVQRVQSLTGLPTLDKEQQMMQLITDLIATNTIGKIELANADSNIQAIEDEENLLVKSKDKELAKLSELAKTTALTADTTQNTLNSYTSYWGLGAILLGFKSLFLHLMWTIIICGVIFFILRALATVNPICGVIFGIFESIAATVIHLIYTLVPASVDTFVNNLQATVQPISLPPTVPITIKPVAVLTNSTITVTPIPVTQTVPITITTPVTGSK